MFTKQKIELGTLKQGKKVILSFPYTDAITVIKIQSPCDCNVPKNHPDRKEIEVIYTPKSVPIHLLNEGKTSYQANKTIVVEYLDDKKVNRIQNLVFTATITQ